MLSPPASAPPPRALRDQPRPAGATGLQGLRGYLRIRVGDYRIFYTVNDDRLIVLIVTLGHRLEVYQDG